VTNFYENTGFIILSRFNSSRLPGKALRTLGGVPLLAHIATKVQGAFPGFRVVIATSSEPSDDPIQALAQKLNIDFYRGPLDNVALRFLETGEKFHLKKAIRITGDSLYIDTRVISRVMDEARDRDFIVASNRKWKMYPVGQTVEIVDVPKFRRYFPELKSADDFEHVTDYFYRHESQFPDQLVHHQNPDGVYREVSLAIDTPDDWKQAERLMLQWGGKKFEEASYIDVYNALKQNAHA
jgi:spore coat polysaccharide biosynthesis protein SpsF